MAGARDYNPPPPFFSSSSPFNHQIHPAESAETKRFNAEWKWMNSSPEAKQRSDSRYRRRILAHFNLPYF